MQTRGRTIFATIRSEGALLPTDLLQRIVNGDRDLPGVTPDAYHLNAGEKLNEATNRAWNRLVGAWAAFTDATAKLPAGDLGTTVTRERWLLPLFSELGYGRLLTTKALEIDGKTYPVSHGWQHTPIHLVGRRVDLDRRAAGVAGASRSSPHGLVQELLNRSDAHLWGMVSNGLRLRVLRDNSRLTRQAYVEFDLEAMMTGEVYADFVLLWLVCHESRVEAERPETCWLEQWSKTAQAQGTRALDQLRNGVEEAITALGRGFLTHPANQGLRDSLRSGTLEAQEYYRQLLRLVYRLLFLFVAEDRDLLCVPQANATARERYTRFYSTARLRRLAERRVGTRHADLFHGLRLVMQKLGSDAGCPELALPALGSLLFSDQAIPALDACEIANHDLLEAIRALAFSMDVNGRRSVDYKNLGSEELGSVYESLLELHPVLHLDAGTFELKTAGGHERKTTGSYYTPTSLIQCLLDSALDPVVAEAARQDNPEAAILRLKICDPACGSGHFLIAAAHRVAKRLAAVRTGDEEPSPEATRTALRDVIGRCIYGVDLNPMAVELCKVSLWMEALEPGKPLSFLDHRIQCGNSLLGATPALLLQGIPDEAFDPIEGDDKEVCKKFRKQNREERGEGKVKLGEGRVRGQMPLFDAADQPWQRLGDLATALLSVEEIPDDTIEGIRRKQERYEELVRSSGYLYGRLWADTWCAAFVWKKTKEFPYPITEEAFRRIERNPFSIASWMREEIQGIAQQYQFLHWHLAFPDVFRLPEKSAEPENRQTGWNGGFDVVLGNPPWERVTVKDKEWFSLKHPDIANARNAASREKLITALAHTDPNLYREFKTAKRIAAGEKALVRTSGLYPLCGKGDVNTFALFAEQMRGLLNRAGRAGLIIPTGIATTLTTKDFFATVACKGEVTNLYDFDNRQGIFPSVQGNLRFCLLTLASQPVREFEVAAQLSLVDMLRDTSRRYTLKFEEICRINPNTLSCPLFLSRHHAEVVKTIYDRIRCLAEEKMTPSNAWPVELRRMLHMGDDSGLFRTLEELESDGFIRGGNVFYREDERFVPLYEAKLCYQFNHRAGTFAGIRAEARFGVHPATNDLSAADLQDPFTVPLPRYWVHEKVVHDYVEDVGFLFGFRDAVSAVADSRSLVAGILPAYAAGDTLKFLFHKGSSAGTCALLAAFNSFVLDYVFRQKSSGGHASFFILEQLPFPGPEIFKQNCTWCLAITYHEWIVSRVLELTYTAWDLEPFAKDCGYEGPPFCWDEGRRFLLRCELDAAYFHLYGIVRDDVDYIMEAFPIVKRKDEQNYDEYRTKRVILEIYDAMADAMHTGKPYRTLLDPPPADPRVAHPPRQAAAG